MNVLHIRCKNMMKIWKEENAKSRSDLKWNYAIKFYACANRFMWNNMVFQHKWTEITCFIVCTNRRCCVYHVVWCIYVEKVKMLLFLCAIETFLHWNSSISQTCWLCFKVSQNVCHFCFRIVHQIAIVKELKVLGALLVQMGYLV